MDTVRLVLGVAAAGLVGLVYYFYIRQVNTGQSHPNVASWSIWAFLTTVNALTYGAMSGDLAATMQFLMSSIGCLGTFFFVLAIGKFSWPRLEEMLLIILGLVAIGVWWFFRSATGANMIILLALGISFIPTVSGLLDDPFKEAPRPWVIATLAYSITTVNVTLKPGWQFWSLLAPVMMALAHGIVAVLATESRKERFRQLATR